MHFAGATSSLRHLFLFFEYQQLSWRTMRLPIPVHMPSACVKNCVPILRPIIFSRTSFRFGKLMWKDVLGKITITWSTGVMHNEWPLTSHCCRRHNKGSSSRRIWTCFAFLIVLLFSLVIAFTLMNIATSIRIVNTIMGNRIAMHWFILLQNRNAEN